MRRRRSEASGCRGGRAEGLGVPAGGGQGGDVCACVQRASAPGAAGDSHAPSTAAQRRQVEELLRNVTAVRDGTASWLFIGNYPAPLEVRFVSRLFTCHMD